MYVYIQTEFAGRDGATNHLWTVGFYDPNGKFHADSDHPRQNDAADRVAWLNGSRTGLAAQVDSMHPMNRYMLGRS